MKQRGRRSGGFTDSRRSESLPGNVHDERLYETNFRERDILEKLYRKNMRWKWLWTLTLYILQQIRCAVVVEEDSRIWEPTNKLGTRQLRIVTRTPEKGG